MPNWRLIPDPLFHGYQCSDHGVILTPKGKLLKQHPAARGAGLRVCVKGTSRLVHKLVLLTFRGVSTERPTHINGNKLDNRLSNLCYGEPNHRHVGSRCSKNHELVGENVEVVKGSRICVACREGKPPVRQLPEYI